MPRKYSSRKELKSLAIRFAKNNLKSGAIEIFLLAILTTNMKNALDNAFLRRIRFVVQFPFPDFMQRAEIWKRIFPTSTPTNGLNVEKLARLNVAGGNIRNIALNAAFLAAEADEPVGMKYILHAARSEYAKLEKPLTEAEIGGWI